MNKRIAAAFLFGMSAFLLNGCAPWVSAAINTGLGAKKTSDEYEQEKQEERVEELNQDYEEFLRSQGETATDDESLSNRSSK